MGGSEQDLWLLATRQRGHREVGTGALFHYDGSAWMSVALWSTSGMNSIAVDSDSVWVSDLADRAVPRAPLARP